MKKIGGKCALKKDPVWNLFFFFSAHHLDELKETVCSFPFDSCFSSNNASKHRVFQGSLTLAVFAIAKRTTMLRRAKT